MKTVKEETVATEEVREEQTQMTEEQRKEAFEAHQAERQAAREACTKDIQKVLEKYGCRLTAQITVSEFRSVPSVFVVDSRNSD